MHSVGTDLVCGAVDVMFAATCSITTSFGAIGTGKVNVTLLASFVTLWFDVE